MSQRKLLLADDSITIQKVVNLTFADEGIEVVTVSDGDAAMEKMSEFKPDLVLADVNMPGLNGYQVCEKIKQNEASANTPVILLVGSFEPFDEAEAQRVGADDFLTKPFQSIRQLVSKVTELLDSDRNGIASTATGNAESLTSAATLESESGSALPETKFNDDGFDDEMIQTNQPLGFGLDESAKFETKEIAESSEDFDKTQPLSAEELQQFSYSAPEEKVSADEQPESAPEEPTATADAAINEDVSEEQSSEEQIPVEAVSDEDQSEKMETESSRSAVDLDFDDDFLELPPDEDDEEEEPEEPEAESTAAVAEAPTVETSPESAETNESPVSETEAEALAESPETTASYNFDETPVAEAPVTEAPEPFETASAPEQNEPHTASFVASSELSSETIDIIVQKVVEKLSDKVVREIAWEVVPQMADLIVKKMAEEKMKQ